MFPAPVRTLVGLNIAIQRSDAQQGEHAVFLSGNQLPLVTIAAEALARDKIGTGEAARQPCFTKQMHCAARPRSFK